MRSQNFERILRNLLAEILRSDLSLPDLHEVADDFLHSGELSRRLGYLLRHQGGLLEQSRDLSAHRVKAVPAAIAADEIFDLVQRRKIPKRVLLEILSSFNPRSANSLRDDKLSVRDALHRFFEEASASERDRLLSLLSGIGDDYLSEMLKRLKE